jgi:formamidopyrimidine-DNA glycosylase
MPELPEVETVVRGLRPLLVGRTITGIEITAGFGRNRSAKVILRRLLTTPHREFARALSGARIEGVHRHGKNIVMPLQRNGNAHGSLVVHLGMTGRLAWLPTPEPLEPHTHFVFALDAPNRWLHYRDPRRFGRLRILRESVSEIDGLGPDPLEISAQEFGARLRTRRSMLKSLLLDQRFLRGLGNIYADESLFRAGLHPRAIAASVKPEPARSLHKAIRETLQAAIASGGSSISSYADVGGRRGWFQHDHQVYGRAGEPCVVCRAPIRRMVIASRSTHYCPRCQRAPRRRRSAR